jgi:hypothetical protein
MSAFEALKLAKDVGVQVSVDGDRLMLAADIPPAPEIVDALKNHKAEIVALISQPEWKWPAEDWQAYFDERAAIIEFDGKYGRAEAENKAFECCIIEWMNCHIAPSEPGKCAWCHIEADTANKGVVVPFGNNVEGHTWLHHDCWEKWYSDRRRQAVQALINVGISPVPRLSEAKPEPEGSI